MADSTPRPRIDGHRSALLRSRTRTVRRPRSPTRSREYISSQWAERAETLPAPREVARSRPPAALRISALHPGKRLIIPAGPAKVRSNDTDYPYRAHSAFSHLTGWGSDAVPDSVLVLEPTADGHEATLYFRPTRRPRLRRVLRQPRDRRVLDSGRARRSPTSPPIWPRDDADLAELDDVLEATGRARPASSARPTATSPTRSTGAACSTPNCRGRLRQRRRRHEPTDADADAHCCATSASCAW